MTHNPAAAHPRLLALIEGMAKHHEARFELDTLARCWDAEEEAWYDFAVAALPPLLADLRRRAEEHHNEWLRWDMGQNGHHACCTTALAAAAGTPALALLAGELQKEMG